jgi:hypothetical protein
MPLAANNNLGELYARRRLLDDEASRLEREWSHLERERVRPNADR